MRTKLITKNVSEHVGYGSGSGDTEHIEYECPCGKGKIIEEHDNIPGFRDHDVWIDCDICSTNYILDTSKGIRNWELVEKPDAVKIQYESKEIETGTLYKYSLDKDTCEINMYKKPINKIVDGGGTEHIRLIDIGVLVPIGLIGKVDANQILYLPVDDIDKATDLIRKDLQRIRNEDKEKYFSLRLKYLSSERLLKKFNAVNKKSGD